MQTPEERNSEVFGLSSSYLHEGSGSLTISSGAEFDLASFYEMQFPWQVSSVIEAEFTAPWNVGSGEFYWYRVEGECERLSCKINNMRVDECNRTLVTIVAARNLRELCRSLKDPLYNPPVKWRLRSIARYSRPAIKSDEALLADVIDGECNTLTEQDFCQVAECFDYCIDQDVLHRGVFSAYAEDVVLKEMSGSLSISGSAETNRGLEYVPSYPNIEFGGSFDFGILLPYSLASEIALSGTAERTSSAYEFKRPSQFQVVGFARTVSPNRNYTPGSDLQLNGKALIPRIAAASGGVQTSGSAEIPRLHSSLGGLEIGGSFSYYGSPIFFGFSGTGAGRGARILIGGSGNFESLGTIQDAYVFNTVITSIKAEYPVLPEVNTLTINSRPVTVSCGCGSLSQSLRLTHNLSASKVFGNFLSRNALLLPYQSQMGYKARDKSWRCVEHYLGVSQNGVTSEDWTVFFTLLCSGQNWVFTFAIKALDLYSGKDKQSKFVLEIPSSLMCSDNNISTLIRTDINTFVPSSTGAQILVVDSDRITSVSPSSRKIDISVDGIYSDFQTFYDDLGLFGDSYWQNTPFEIRINPEGGMAMTSADLTSIIPSQPAFPTP